MSAVLMMKDKNGIELQVGHICKMYPYVTLSDRLERYRKLGNFYKSQAKKPYYVEIVPYEKNAGDTYTGTMMTNIPGKHGAWIHDYMLARMEVVGTKETHGHLLFNQFEDQETIIEENPFELSL